MVKKTLRQHLDEKIKITANGCWEWVGARNNKGYGTLCIRIDGIHRPWLAHRLVYELYRGPIPNGLPLDHLCKNRACVNPAHLEPVTTAENNRRSPQIKKTGWKRNLAGLAFGIEASATARRAKTHCKRGHPLSGDNLTIDKHGWRYCRACDNERERLRRIGRSIRSQGGN